MVEGTKLTLVYHLYCNSVEDFYTSSYGINQRCLFYFHHLFDEAIFWVCSDNVGDPDLMACATNWIFACGFKDNVTIKFKPNSPYRGANTFYNEIALRLDDFDGMVFYGHNKGGSYGDTKPIRQWTVFLYYSCLWNISNNVKLLADKNVACTYLILKNSSQETHSPYGWLNAGGMFLFNPRKVSYYLKRTGKELPKLVDKFYDESFLANIFDLDNLNYFKYGITFDGVPDYCAADVDLYNEDNLEIVSWFLPPEIVKKYDEFFNRITEGIPYGKKGNFLPVIR